MFLVVKSFWFYKKVVKLDGLKEKRTKHPKHENELKTQHFLNSRQKLNIIA